MKRWRLPLVLAAVALVAVAGALAVGKASASANPQRGASSSACSKLMSDSTANNAMQQLHREHAVEMQTWRAKYAADPTTPQARQALADLRREHMADMRARFHKLGIRVPAGLCSSDMTGGSGSGMMGAGSGDMMGSGASMMGGSTTGSSIHEQHHSGQATEATPGGMMGGESGAMMSL